MKNPEQSPPTGGRAAAAVFVPRAVLAGVIPLLGIAAAGFAYYSLPLGERLRSDLHPWLKPSGWVGQSVGLLAFALFLFLWLYPIRKRLPKAKFLGPVPRWLDAHIVAGVLMPLAGAIHAGFRFTGLIGVGYFSMLVVAISGVIGRYLYLRIPRSRAGLELGREQVSADQRRIVAELVEKTGLDPVHLQDLLRPVQHVGSRTGVLATLGRLVRDDLERRRAVRSLERELRGQPGASVDPAALKQTIVLARREMALAQQIRALDATNRVFRLWHAFHLPFAITAFLAVAVHVAVAILFGATWLR